MPKAASPGLVAAIALSYRGLRKGMAAFLAGRPRDAQLLMLSMLAAFVGFVAGLPAAVQQAQDVTADDPLTAVMSVRLFAALFMSPLLLFALGALSHLLARLFRGKGSFWAARAAVVWAVIVALPLLLLNGLAGAAGQIWPQPEVEIIATVVSALTAMAFVWIWAQHLAEAEGFGHGSRVFGVMLLFAAVTIGCAQIIG